MKIGIIGAGSLGLLWATRLIKHGSVTLFCRTEEQVTTIQQSGISVTTLTGEKETYRVSVKWIQQSIHSAPYDMLFLMVKQPALDEVLRILPPFMHPNTHVVAWQNGLGHGEKLQSLQHPHVYAAVTTEGAYKFSANEVRHTGEGYIRLGHLLKHDVSDVFGSFLERIGVKIVPDIILVMWRKFAINCVINPLTALLEVPNGQLIRPKIEPIIDVLIQELCLVANHRGIMLTYEDIYYQVTEVCHKTARNISSMLQDIQANRQTEIEALNQMVIEYSRDTKISVPYHQVITQLIRAKSLLP
jgi:2-dehydropantoate 2-reductase